MKRILTSVLLLALALPALATTKPPTKPSTPPSKPVNTVTQTANPVAGADADAAAKAAAEAEAAAKAAAAANLNNSSPSSASLQETTDVNSRAWSLFVPPSVFTPPMPRPEVPMGCPAPTETQSALEVGKGVLFSKADSFRDNNPCVAIKYSQLLWDRCQYRKADRALQIGLKLFAKTAGEEWDASADPNLHDYKVEECAALRNPPAAAPVTNVYNYVTEAPKTEPVATCAPPPKTKPKKPTAVAKPANSCQLKT